MPFSKPSAAKAAIVREKPEEFHRAFWQGSHDAVAALRIHTPRRACPLHFATDRYHRVLSDLERHLEMRKPFLEGH
jgi:hypothetical protein